ncbi:GGDEF domain-containing protein [Shewanella eurypsychrophilus]|uniref:GGDEF domain-containing protein n=1 Tax=Shewanella eurypsychrophilus TaxID=2593656 RepID=A0ABX6V5D3_9GAMM|nr:MULTISPECIES: GGDEF domain-containing protein [Shewanella]QFU21456.1 diguanylate cyclase [Shewanella sp. YLB-09]QPG56746.1 GGDEF domain-containing protein [Shewanella eurypsychrophilus]
MLAQNNHHLVWLREQDHPAISLTRWQQQVDLLNSFYRSQASVIVQLSEDSFQIVCARQKQPHGLSGGTTFLDAGLLHQMQSQPGYGLSQVQGEELNSSLSQFERLLCQLIFWPSGELFGCILICEPGQDKHQERLTPVIETTKALIQAELKHLFLMQKVQMLSVQDDQTCMLNQYGFSLMAPRQLSLSRRFGSHAGIILIEVLFDEQNKQTSDASQQIMRSVARIIHHSLRDADVSARISDNQFIILCFIDNESNLDSLVLRLKKQLLKEANAIRIAIGQSYFTPDTQISLLPMQEQATESLEVNRLELLNMPAQ